MRKIHLFFALGFSALFFLQSCKKGGDTPTPPGSGGAGSATASDSIYLPASIRWTNFGFGNPGTLATGVIYDAQKRVTQIGGGVGGVFVKPFYYADGRTSH